MQVQGLPEGSNARRVFCGPMRLTRRLPRVRLSEATRQAMHRRDKREAVSTALERPWLRAARTARGLRIRDVARAIGLSAPSVLRLEQLDRHRTTERRAHLLQQLLGLSDEQRAEVTTSAVTRWS